MCITNYGLTETAKPQQYHLNLHILVRPRSLQGCSPLVRKQERCEEEGKRRGIRDSIVSATLQLGGNFLLSVSRCTRTRATDGSVPVATLRYIVDCRRRDPPRLRRRNLLLLLRLRLRPAVSHAGALFRLVLLPASAAASAA